MRILSAGMLALSLVGAAAAEEEVSTSSAPARAQATEGPRRPGFISIDVIRDRRDWRLQAGYSLRWDFGDLRHLGPGTLRTLRDPRGLLPEDPWELADNTRLLLYGVRIRPGRVFTQKRPPGASVAHSNAAAGGEPPGAAAAPDRREFRVSLQPVFDDLTRNLEEDLRRLALREGFRRLPTEAGRISDDDKRRALSELVDYQRGREAAAWPLDGLDYLLKTRNPSPPPLEPVRLSTMPRPASSK